MNISRLTIFAMLVALAAAGCKKEDNSDEIYTFPDRHPTFEKVNEEGGVAVWFKNATEGVALRNVFQSNNSTRIVRTTNGGAVWTTVLDIPDQSPREMEFLPNSPVGYFTTWQALYRSSDYGSNWTKVYDTGSQWVNVGELCVISEDIVLLGFDGKLNKSKDGGQNWQALKTFDLSTGNNMTTLWFVTENQGFIGYRDGTVERTADGGQNWQASNTGFNDEVTRFFFRDSQHGYATCFYREYIAVTDDGGQNWTLGNPSDRLSGYFQMWFDDAGNGLLTARSNKVFYSEDNGKNNYLFLNAPSQGDEPGFIQVTPDGTIWAGFSNSLYKINLHR